MFGLTGGIKWAVLGLVGLAVVSVIGAATWHYVSLLDEITTLEKNNTKLEFAVEQQGVTIDRQADAIDNWETSQDRLLDTLDQMQQVQRNATSETRRLNDAFSRRDLGNLAAKKPGLVERRINDGSNRTLCLLERATGSDGADCPD